MSFSPEYTIVNAYKGSQKNTIFNPLNTEVNNKIKEGYTPLGSPGIITQGMDQYVYQALIKPPASASSGSSQEINNGGSKSRSRKSYKKYTKKSSSRRHKNRK